MDYKSGHHTFYHFLLSLLLLLRSAQGQTITLDYFIQSGSCTNGDLLENNDLLILNGTVDLESASPAEWKLDIPIQYQVQGTFETICTVRMINSCTNNGTNCYCTSQSGTIYNFIFKSTAARIHHRVTMRAELSRYDGRGSKNATVVIPDVYGNEIATLTINGDVNDHESCNLTLTQDTPYNFTWSLSNLKNPNVSMQFGSTSRTLLHTENSNTITREIKTPPKVVYLNYTFAYTDDCKRSKEYYCFVSITSTTTLPTFSMTTITASTSTATTPGPSPINLLIIGLGVGLGLGLPLLLILVIVIVWIRCPISFCKQEDSCFGKKHTPDNPSSERGRQLHSTNKSSVANGTTKNQASTNENYNESTAKHIGTRRALPPLGHIQSSKIYPEMPDPNETSIITTNETPKRKKGKKKKSNRNNKNGKNKVADLDLINQ